MSLPETPAVSTPFSATKNPSLHLSQFSVIFAIMLIQAGALLSKSVSEHSSIPLVITMRFGFAALSMLLLSAFSKKETKATEHTALLPAIGYPLIHGLSLLCTIFMFYASLQFIPLSVGATLEFCGPLYLAIKHSSSVYRRMAGISALTGVLLLTHPWTEHIHTSGTTLLGLLLGAGAATSLGFYIFISQRGRTYLGNPTTSITRACTVATLLSLPVLAIHHQITHASIQPSWHSVMIMLLVGSLGTALSYTIDNRAIQKIGLSRFSMLLSFEPVVATLIDLTFNHILPGLLSITGIVLVCTANVLISLKEKKD